MRAEHDNVKSEFLTCGPNVCMLPLLTRVVRLLRLFAICKLYCHTSLLLLSFFERFLLRCLAYLYTSTESQLTSNQHKLLRTSFVNCLQLQVDGSA